MNPEPAAWGRLEDPSYGEAFSAAPGAVSYRLLGPLEIRKDGKEYTPTAPKILQLLAMLLLQAGKVVHIDSIIQELWPDGPPRSVRTTMQTYVYQLRKSIEWNQLASHSDELLVTRSPGYMFMVPPSRVDVFSFQQLCHQGRELLERREFQQAARHLRVALSLWSGPALANVQCGPVLSAYAVDLEEQRRNALHLCIEAELERGLHRDLIGELRSLVTANPLDEGLHGLLMRALSASGRRSDALAAYRELRGVLNEELGVEPCDELQQLHRELLSLGEPPAFHGKPAAASGRPAGANGAPTAPHRNPSESDGTPDKGRDGLVRVNGRLTSPPDRQEQAPDGTPLARRQRR
ncbi:MAG: AfsR/SARP family transcriptional regulator [Micromonosporaceae bacterium]